MKVLSRVLAASTVLLMPMVILAQPNADASLGYFDNFGKEAIGLINNVLIPLVFALAILALLWGILQAFIIGGGDEEKQKQGKQLIMYAIIGFVVMVALWGIVNLIATGIFGLNPLDTAKPPASVNAR
jgi:hypothetical protein